MVAGVLLMSRLVMVCGHGPVRRRRGRHRVARGRRRCPDPGCRAVELQHLKFENVNIMFFPLGSGERLRQPYAITSKFYSKQEGNGSLDFRAIGP